MKANSREVVGNQQGPHEDIVAIVKKYQHSVFRKPVAQHTQDAFTKAMLWLQDWQGPVIIDACCGVGESTAVLAARYPQARVLGIDKSAARLAKHAHYAGEMSDNIGDASSNKTKPNDANSKELKPNYLVLQADLNDFWRLLAQALNKGTKVFDAPNDAAGIVFTGDTACTTLKNADEEFPAVSNTPIAWHIQKQYLLYPNPYPKKAQVQKRWHASPAFLSMLAVCPNIEVRSNWLVYLQEFQIALQHCNITSDITQVSSLAITPFERKYLASNQACWQLQTLP